jgi:hypothetical protein
MARAADPMFPGWLGLQSTTRISDKRSSALFIERV